MRKKIREAAVRACWQTLIPLARILIRFGLGHKDFVDISRSAFVIAAGQELDSDDRKPTATRIAARTGLSRREVGKIRDDMAPNFEEIKGCLPITDVLSEWGSSSQYMGKNGAPIILPLKSATSPSLEQLVQSQAPNLSANSVVTELLSFGCISEVDGGYKLVSRQFVPIGVEPRTVELAGRAMFALGSTIAQNLSGHASTGKIFERMAVSTRLEPQAVPRLLSQIGENGKNLLEIADDWIVSNELPIGEVSNQRITGVGVYAFDIDDFVFDRIFASKANT